MKKTGFTLAEVLITLAIIGVIATLTLPALMTNTAEQQYKTGFRKGINTLTEAAQMSQSSHGFDYGSVNVDSDPADTEDVLSVYSIFAQNASIDPGKSGTTNQAQLGAAGTSNFVVFFHDGTALAFPASGANMTTATYKAIQSDGLPYGIPAVYDVNGPKGPNLMSNCNGDLSGATTSDSTGDAKTACTKEQRVIKDQFGVRLRGGYAFPNGAAARWAMEN